MASQQVDKELCFDGWERAKAEGNPPRRRYGHACAVVGSRMYMFGGGSTEDQDTTSYFNDMHILHLGDSLRWEVVDQEGDIPSGREGHTLNAIEDELYMFGGVDKEGTFTCAEGLYVFKTDSCSWALRVTEGATPKAQSLSAVVSEMRLFTFGGVLNGEAQNDVHILDIASMEWSLANTTGTPPLPRCDHASVVVGRRMYVTGGSGRDDLWYNDLHQLNLETLEWAAVDMGGIPPKPRDYTTLICLANWYLLLFGGFSGTDGSEQAFADLHFTDITAKSLRWTKVPLEDDACPPPRYGHSAIVHQKILYVFAGQNTEEELNDLWTIKALVPAAGFEPTPVPRTRYTTSIPIPTPRKQIPPTPIKRPVKPRDFEELRSTYVKRINEMFDTLAEKFQHLDTATETLAAERAAFEAEKKAHSELYEKQQQELKGMLESHRQQNEEWMERMRLENDAERRALAEERARQEKVSVELAKEQEMFTAKSKKLDAIMKQVQGLNT